MELVLPDRVLIDTGPIVAILRPDDSEHQLCVTQSQDLRYPFLTSWAVLTEAAWLLRNLPNGVAKLLAQIEQRLIVPLDLKPHDVRWLRDFLEKYDDLGAQLADASICCLAEREGIHTIFTLDRRDFMVYRNSQNQGFHLVPSR